jgi:hypothetical protein
MTFQFHLLQSKDSKQFTPQVLKEARRVFKDIRLFLMFPDPEVDPFRIPQFDSLEELKFFLALVGDDEWFIKYADIMELKDSTGNYLGFTLRKDRKMWLSKEGRAHLKATELQAFTPLTYLKRQLKESF